MLKIGNGEFNVGAALLWIRRAQRASDPAHLVVKIQRPETTIILISCVFECTVESSTCTILPMPSTLPSADMDIMSCAERSTL